MFMLVASAMSTPDFRPQRQEYQPFMQEYLTDSHPAGVFKHAR
jgi:hypothetical protein